MNQFWKMPLIERMVDFDQPIGIFEAILSKQSNSCLVKIQAPALSGKTSFCEKIRVLTESNSNATFIRFDFEQKNSFDLFSVISRIIEALDCSEEHFQDYYNLVAPPYIKGGVDFGSYNYILNSSFGDIIGGSTFNHIDISNKQVLLKLIATFVNCWRRVPSRVVKDTVIVFDSFERCLEEVSWWILEMLIPLFVDRLSGRCIIVLSGQTIPEIKLDDTLSHLVCDITLPLLKLEHIREYVSKAGVVLEENGINLLYSFTNGEPALVEMCVRHHSTSS